jgi:hypothetical protein
MWNPSTTFSVSVDGYVIVSDVCRYEVRMEYKSPAAPPQHYTVLRRFSEFDTLRQAVPGAPALPPKSIFSRRDSDFLHQRRLRLDQWLRSLIEDLPAVPTSWPPHLQAFLRVGFGEPLYATFSLCHICAIRDRRGWSSWTPAFCSAVEGAEVLDMRCPVHGDLRFVVASEVHVPFASDFPDTPLLSVLTSLRTPPPPLDTLLAQAQPPHWAPLLVDVPLASNGRVFAAEEILPKIDLSRSRCPDAFVRLSVGPVDDLDALNATVWRGGDIF